MMRYSIELIDAKQSTADALETSSIKSNSKKQQSQPMISLAVEFLIKLQKPQEIYHRLVQGKLKVKQKIYRSAKIRYISPGKRQKIIDDLIVI